MEGQQCDKCKGSFFNLQSDEPEGCIPCFCFQLSKDCKCADFYKDIVSHNTCGKKKIWNDFKSQNKMQSIVALRTPLYYGPFNNQGEQPNPRQKSIADVWLKESSATMDSCYYENLLTVPGVSTTGRSSVHAQCLASVFLYWAVHFDRFFFYFWFVCFQVFVLTFSLLQMVHTRNFVTKNTDSGNAIRYLHLSTIHLVWHPPPPQNKKKCA